MTELTQLYDDRLEDAHNKTIKTKAKKDAIEQGSKELRDASMTGLVPHERLSDITQLEGSSLREKQAQK